MVSDEIVIVEGVRTPQGALGGAFKDCSAQRLGQIALRALLERTKLDPSLVDEVIFGCVGQGSDAPNIGRVIALMAGVPKTVPGFTVARNCASGIQAIVSGCQSILSGDAQILMVGGVESMSSQPYLNRDLRFGKRLRNSEMVDALWEGLTDPICGQLMGRTAENLAEEFKISREEQDRYAVLSHQRAFRAAREGRSKEEIVPVSVEKKAAGRPVPPEIVSQDEGINPALSEQTLALYPPIFKENGTVTAGNSCGIADGAAALLLTTRKKAEELKFGDVLGTIRSYAFGGVEPHRMGIGPTVAIPRALQKARLELKDMELVELNEAFAAQVIACEKVLGLRREILNVNGGAIAIGHPVGMTGARITLALLYEMKRRKLRYGIASLCVGGGQGAALVLERK
ncbi:MAG: thiolase family protein [Candidatus Omnitrophica bacterium]|nr:thiolase family protein [Candidatus Omnitrophota bacterium]